MNQSEKRLFLIQSLLKERPEYRDIDIPAEPESQRQLLRGLMNIRAPQRIGADFLKMQDAHLQGETTAKGITDIADLTPLLPGLLYSQPPLHRQRHSHLCRCRTAAFLCGTDGTAGLSRTHRTGKNHACV